MTTEDLKMYNNKRAFRRKQLHNWSKRLAEEQAKPLKDMNDERIDKIRQDLRTLEEVMEELGEEAYQKLSEEAGLLAKEQDAQDLFEQELSEVLDLANRLHKLKTTYVRHRKVQLEGRALIDMGPNAALAEKRYTAFIATCQDLVTDGTLLDHPQMAAEHAATEKLMTEAQECLLAKKKGHDEDDGEEEDAPTRTSRPIFMGPGLHLDMPQYDGQPRSWAKFKRMFQIVLDTKGSHYDAVAKSVLLENAMKTKEAKDVVMRNATGDDPYLKAMTALNEHYGNPRVLLPLLVRDLTHNEEQYAYTKEGLQALYDKYVTTYEHLHEIINDSLTTFLCQCAREHFAPKLREEWDRFASPLPALPTIANMRDFINKLVTQMEPSTTMSTTTRNHKQAKPLPHDGSGSFTKCPFCKGPHPPIKCAAFINKDVTQRYQMVRDNKLCLNCLRPGHAARQCQGKIKCKNCGKSHHTMIHLQRDSPTTSTTPPAATSMKVDPVPSNNATPTLSFIDTILVEVSNGSLRMKARAALDSGAGISMISENLATTLKLPRLPQKIAYEGIRGRGVSKAYVNARLTSTRDASKFMDVSLSVIPKLNPVHRPRDVAGLLKIKALQELQLSDPDLGGHIDLLLGNLDRNMCIDGAPVALTQEKITLTPTIFGWSVAGPLDGSNPSMLQTTAKPDDLYQVLTKQWELEAIPAPPNNEDDNDPAVNHFNMTHTRHASGRYVVELPRKKTPPTLGKSRRRAIKRYMSNEKSLRDKGTYEQFQAVLTEYITMGHAEYVPRPLQEDHAYYLPVHGVTKADSTTTKLRAVFDASAPTSTGISLNDTLEAGPNLYPALPDILIRFRSHPIALTADIGKMFREVMLHPSEQDYHRFFIRSPDGELRDCRMTRLTFGVKSSPFLATQVLRDLASQHSTSHPHAANVIKTDFYVDDCLTGVNSVEEGKKLRETLCMILQTAGMTLRKWRTNCPALLHDIPPELQETADLTIRTSEEAPKALGIHWDVQHDVLHVSTPVDTPTTTITKRIVASVTAQIFDVLGLMSPAVIPGKILLQSLWKTQLKWDDPLPDDKMKEWNTWVTQLPYITSCSIPRRMTKNDSPVMFKSLHGFADASSLAYGAVVYLRTVHEDGNTEIAIVTAKARVLPLKTITIPRAELVAASLLTKLLTYTARILNVPHESLHAWTDSAIVLHWLQKPPSALKVFVRNRVSHIQEHLPPSHWRHVGTTDNPADLLSRGCPATELTKNQLWWKGPPWLMYDPGRWKTKQMVKVMLPVPEIRAEVNSMKITLTPPPEEWWARFSSFTHATRIISWARRFANNARRPASARTTTPYLTSDELLKTKQQLLHLAQEQSFPEVREAIKSRKPLPKNHFLFRTNLHVNNTLPYFTVSGRLRNASHPTSVKQLIPLRAKAPLTTLFLKSCHSLYGHPGTEALMAILSEQFYVQGARNALKKISRQCVTCQKIYARPLQPAMGLLPSLRTTPAPPFLHTGLDFAGPFKSRRGHTRKPVYQDCYVCLFICMTTRAVHLDVCMDLSTEEFLAVLRRFMARRGVPNTLYSDNGTNFVGASSEVEKFLQQQDTKQTMSHLTSTHDVKWNFIPPRAPHMGGLWEAGVRQMKTLLKKIVKPHPLRVDEFYTILTEVEATLNSRPLAPLQGDGHPEDMVLTPGHFLIHRPLKAPPLPQELSKTTTTTHLKRWALVQHLNQTLWDHWLRSYLQSRFARSKWHKKTPDVKIGDIVLVRDITLRRRAWPLGRITQTFPGTDGVTRTVEVLCNGKLYTRAVHMLCPLMNVTASDDPTMAPPEAVEEPESSNPQHDGDDNPQEDDEDDEPAEERQNANILILNLPINLPYEEDHLPYDEDEPTLPDDDDDTPDVNLPQDPGDYEDAPKLTQDDDAMGRNHNAKSHSSSSTCKEAPRDFGEVTTPPRESVRDMGVPVPPWTGSQTLHTEATKSSPAEDRISTKTTPLGSTPSSEHYVE